MFYVTYAQFHHKTYLIQSLIFYPNVSALKSACIWSTKHWTSFHDKNKKKIKKLKKSQLENFVQKSRLHPSAFP